MRLFRPDGEWLACFCSWCWHGRSEVYFGKDRATEEHATCPRHQEGGSLLCKEGFKLVFESNKVVVSRYGLFVEKGMIVVVCFAFPWRISVIKS